MNRNKKYYYLTLIGIMSASYYPIYMGVLAITDYLRKGSIDVANYPKYIIPYTPICFALIIATAFMPVILKFFKRFALPMISLLGVGVFLIGEILLENMVIMTSVSVVKLESWQ